MSAPTDAADVRFAFGRNWLRFLETVDEARVDVAATSMAEFLGPDGLRGRRVLDLGSGSGLFSLAATRLGAAHVTSVDFDADAVACTLEMKRRFAPDAAWDARPGDATDPAAMAALGTFDVVYSWGVLHHTGQMWAALENACRAVSPGGRLFVSIYNDQGRRSRAWASVKRIYAGLPPGLRPLYVVGIMAPRELASLALRTAQGRPGEYVQYWTQYRRRRGMSRWHDLVDWVGGYPFEVAKPEEVFDRCRAHGFGLERLTTTAGGLGCNQFLFVKDP